MEIKVKHPFKENNDKQEKFMSSIPEKDKEYHALLLSHGNACYLYHKLDIEPTEQDFKEWVDGLGGNFKTDMESKGFDTCKSILSFTRYVREKRDIGMEEFVRERMGEEVYQKYKSLFDDK